MGTNKIAVLATATDEDLLAPVVAARARLTGAIVADTRAEELAGLLNAVAGHEAVANLRASVRAMTTNGSSAQDIDNHLVNVALDGPRDTYSGRANDVRRAAFEAVLTEVRDLRFALAAASV